MARCLMWCSGVASVAPLKGSATLRYAHRPVAIATTCYRNATLRAECQCRGNGKDVPWPACLCVRARSSSDQRGPCTLRSRFARQAIGSKAVAASSQVIDLIHASSGLAVRLAQCSQVFLAFAAVKTPATHPLRVARSGSSDLLRSSQFPESRRLRKVRQSRVRADDNLHDNNPPRLRCNGARSLRMSGDLSNRNGRLIFAS